MKLSSELADVLPPKKMLVQGMVDRDLYFQFRDLLAAHKLTIAQGIGWAMRSLLIASGVKVRNDRGQRQQNGTERRTSTG